jgi:hypothetical protein
LPSSIYKSLPILRSSLTGLKGLLHARVALGSRAGRRTAPLVFW